MRFTLRRIEGIEFNPKEEDIVPINCDKYDLPGVVCVAKIEYRSMTVYYLQTDLGPFECIVYNTNDNEE